jgi:Zn-finger nucleic acid-binding protein
MDCPKCHQALETVTISRVRVNRCPKCAGTWYDKDELRVLKDKESRGDYSWVDVDLWKDIDEFRARRQQRYSCPRDGSPMTTVHYGDSSIAVDICSECRGIWLDKEEYGEILRYLENTVDSKSAQDYLKDMREELVEVLEGRETPLGAIGDLGKILYMLELRFVIDHPRLARIASALPKF